MRFPSRLQIAMALALAMSAGGCGLSEPRVCTLIGCDGGVWVRVEEPTAGPVRVRATFSDGTVMEAECSGTFACRSDLFFENVTAPSGVLEVEMDGEVRTLSVTLTYVETRPNGPDCPPPCPIATVSLKHLT